MSSRKTKIRKIIEAGPLVRQAIYTPPTNRDAPRERREKEHATTAARQRMNDKRAKKQLELLLAANFDHRDVILTLTYDREHLPRNRKESVRCLTRFIRRLRDSLRRQGRSLDYIYTTEEKHGAGRLHHHMALNLTPKDKDLVCSLWENGSVKEMKHLERDNHGNVNYYAIAEYMAKESVEGRPVGARMWTCSKYLKKPVHRTEWVSENTVLTVPVRCFKLQEENRWSCWGGYQYLEYYDPGYKRAARRRE